MGRVTGRRPLLVVVNGLPGSGKSTLARRYAAGHLDAVVVDVDAVRAATQPDPLSHEAGLRAREVAAAQVREHLVAGRDVVVPQLLVRPDFLAVLSDVARDAGADLRHVVLLAGPDVVRSRLATRQAASARPEHALAARLLVAAAGPEPVDGTEADTTLDMLRALQSGLDAMTAGRPGTRLVDARGEEDLTYAAFVAAISDPGPSSGPR